MVNKSTTQALLASCLMCSTVMPSVSVADVGSVRSASNRIIASVSAAHTEQIAVVVFFFPKSLLK